MSASAAIDGIHQADALSIIVQGPLDRANASALADACRGWRRLFPAAQLICSLSSSDFLIGTPLRGATTFGALPPGMAAGVADAVARIEQACDVLVFAQAAASLPPMKNDSRGPNNVNLMIAAAEAGLSHANGRYVLRIRNDLLFRDHSFLSAFAAGQDAPRGAYALFEQRLLISQVFTLNPLTLSRLPFHFSDWFHFGLARDVRRLWQAVRPMSSAGATYYHSNPHSPASNAVERRFHARLAPEQLVSFPALELAFPELTLARHNDPASLEQSLLVLADNFAIADLAAIGASLPEYQDVIDAMSPYTRLECMSQTLLEARAFDRDRPAHALYADAVAQTQTYHALRARTYRKARSLLMSAARTMRRRAPVPS